LSVDTNGDGKVDKQVKGAYGFLVLKAKDSAGEPLEYAVRFKVDQKVYKYASSGVMRGRLNGESVLLIDQNNNGTYNEVGVDAMVVGKSKAASFVSKVVNLKGELFEVSISDDGKSMEARPFAGESGTLDLRSGFKAKGKLESAVVKSADGQYSFNLGDGSMNVPAGDYTIAYGLAGKASETVTIGTGKMSPVNVKAGRETALTWGGPIIADFPYSRDGLAVKVEPASVKFYGKAGEEYTDFLPQGQSPKFLVYEERTEKLLKTGRFGT
jgi:hypothetical protein